MFPLDGSPIGVTDDWYPLPVPEVPPVMGASGSPMWGSRFNESGGKAVGDSRLGGTVDDEPLGGPVGPASFEPGGFDLPGWCGYAPGGCPLVRPLP